MASGFRLDWVTSNAPISDSDEELGDAGVGNRQRSPATLGVTGNTRRFLQHFEQIADYRMRPALL